MDSEDAPLSAKRPRFYREVRWAPCSLGRGCAFLMIPFVIALVALTYVPYCKIMLDRGTPGRVCLLIFHGLLLLMTISYVQVVSTDPGTVPQEWHDAVTASGGNSYKKCKHTHFYKPLRAHYCSISRRVVLNFDHFCPWVANAVGFWNRKFFILFCLYSFLTSLFCAISLGPVVLFPSEEPSGAAENNSLDKALAMMAFIMDATFAVALSLFWFAHLYMAMRNQSSLEDSKQSKRYDLGWYENMQTVFGIEPWAWFLPMQTPLLGDGIHWKLSDGSWDGFAPSFDPS